MSLQSHLTALAQSIGSEVKALFVGKQTNLISGENIKTINGQSLLGSGDLTFAGGGVASSVRLVTTDPLPVLEGTVSLPSTPIGDIIWNVALVYTDVTVDDLTVLGKLRGTRDYQIQEHIVKVVDGELVFSSPIIDGSYVVVSYLASAP